MSKKTKASDAVVVMNPERGVSQIGGATYVGVRADPGFAQPVLRSDKGEVLLIDPRAFVLTPDLNVLYDPGSHVFGMDGQFKQWMLDHPEWPPHARAEIEEGKAKLRRQRLERRRKSRQRRGEP